MALTNEELLALGKKFAAKIEKDKSKNSARRAAVSKLIKAHPDEYQKYLGVK
jgi:hypothetical protein